MTIYNVFFFNDTATTEIYTLSLHDALPIFRCAAAGPRFPPASGARPPGRTPNGRSPAIRPPPPSADPVLQDRKSTRLNSSHANISYAVFCLKKKQILFFHTTFSSPFIHLLI